MANIDNMKPFYFSLSLVLLLGGLPLTVSANEQLAGSWVTDAELSTPLDPFRRVELDIQVEGKIVTIEETFTTGRRNHTETYRIDTSKELNRVPVSWWSANRHIGAYIGGDQVMKIQADWIDEGQTLRLKSDFVLETSQSETPVRTYTEYRISRDGSRLTKLELRSSRNLPIVHVFNRK